MKKGLLIILSGPSGVGKGTVRQYIMDNFDLPLTYSISMTTRKPRLNEKDGVDYYFVSNEEFQKNIDEDNFLEWAEFVGNRYGTPKDKVNNLREKGENVLLEIETSGSQQVLEKLKDDDRVISFFLIPPDFKELEDRIRKRQTESDKVIAKRLDKGRKEMSLAPLYDYVILNDKVEDAGQKMISILKSYQ